MVPERNIIVPERNIIVPERNIIVPERNIIVPKRNIIVPERKHVVSRSGQAADVADCPYRMATVIYIYILKGIGGKSRPFRQIRERSGWQDVISGVLRQIRPLAG